MVAVPLRLDPLDARIGQILTWNESAQRVSLVQRGHAGREGGGTRQISREEEPTLVTSGNRKQEIAELSSVVTACARSTVGHHPRET